MGIAAALLVVGVTGALAAGGSETVGAEYVTPNGLVYQVGPNGSYNLVAALVTINGMQVHWVVWPAPAPNCSTPTVVSVKANGNEVILPNGNVYQFGSDGQYHLVPDLGTANAMGIQWSGLSAVGDVAPVGAPIPSVCPGP